MDDLWNSFLGHMPAVQASMWRLAVATKRDGSHLIVTAKDPAWADLIKSDLMPSLSAHCHKMRIEVIFGQAQTTKRIVKPRVSPPGQQSVTDRFHRNTSASGAVLKKGERLRTFATFLTDPGNEFAISAARRVAESPGSEWNPFVIHGPSGCGKTHLLQAISHEVSRLGGMSSVLVLPMADFAADLAGDPQGVIAKVRSSLDSAAVLGLDGIDVLSDLPLAQEACYSLINQSLDEGRQVIVTSLLAPKLIATLESRLLTRLMAGLLVSIDAPLIETRSAYLRSLIGTRFDQQDPERLQEILKTRVFTMRQVEDLARRLDAGERLAAPLAALDAIVRVVAASYQIRPEDLTSASRERACSQARQTALLLARRLTNYSLVGLGSMTGGRDHSTVIYAVRTAEKRAMDDPTYAALLETLSQKALQER